MNKLYNQINLLWVTVSTSDPTHHATILFNSYKRHVGQSAVRLSLAGRQLTRRQPVPENWNSEGDYEAVLIKIGYERTLTPHRLSPYVAADLVGIKSSAEGFFGGGFLGIYRDFEVDQLGIGLSPTLGLRYRPLRWLSLFAETSLDILFSRYRSQYVRTWPEIPNPRSTENTTGFGGKFHPLSTLVLNVTF